jgi:hypothetical protein
MPDRPPFPRGALVTWLVISTSLATIALLFFPNPPYALRFVVAGLVTVGASTVIVFYLGRRWEWARCHRVLRDTNGMGEPTP